MTNQDLNNLLRELPFTDPLLTFSTLLAAILLGPLIFNRFKLPGVIGVIILGVIIGPNSLGLLNVEGSVTMLGQVGLLYIMFLAGLEIDLNDFFRHKRRSIIFGVLTFTIPQVAGTLIFLALGYNLLASLLIASMFASHTLVAYPVIQRLGLTKNNAVLTAVGGTILTDTAALLLLAVIVRAHQGSLDAAFWLGLAIKLSLYLLLVIKLIPRLCRWFFRSFEDESLEFLFVLVLTFGLSYLARLIGIEPIVGAFFVGLALNPLIPSSSVLMNRIGFVGNSLFIPFFLLYIGMLVDVSVLASSLAVWGVMAAMLGTNMGTKLISAKATEKLFSYSRAEGWIIFGLSTTEAAATLAATLVGYRIGLIGDEVLNGVILMILVTCICGPSIVQHFGKVVVVESESVQEVDSEGPQRILIPLANPETAKGLVELGLMLRTDKAEPLYPLTVASQEAQHIASAVIASEKMLARVGELAAAANVPVIPITRVDVNVSLGIARAAKERRISDLVIGWNGAVSAQLKIFGTVLDQLIERTDSTVFVCRLRHPIALHRRLLLLVPPLSDKEPGFGHLLKSVKLILSGAGLSLQVFATLESTSNLEHAFGAPQYEVPCEFVTLETWSGVLEKLKVNVKNEDLIVLIGARRHSVAWTADTDRMPKELVKRFDEHDLIVAYPRTADSASNRSVELVPKDENPNS